MGVSAFCSIETLNWLAEAHPLWGEQSALLSLLHSNASLIPKHPLRHTYRMFDQMPGHRVPIKFTYKINHHNVLGSIISTNNPWLPGIPDAHKHSVPQLSSLHTAQPLQSIVHFAWMSWSVPLPIPSKVRTTFSGKRLSSICAQNSYFPVGHSVLYRRGHKLCHWSFTFFHRLEAHDHMCRPLLERTSHLTACIWYANLPLDLNLLF